MLININIKYYKKLKPNKKQLVNNLKNILFEQKKDYKQEILNCKDLLEAHAYCKSNKLESNSFGLLIEHYILHTKKYNLIKNNSTNCIGDFNQNGINFELKCSLGGKNNNQFNFVQIRPTHNCNYVLCAYYLSKNNYKNLGELFVFVINNNEMKDFILNYGSYAHGTIKKLGKINKKTIETPNIEFALRPKINSYLWEKLLKFRVKHI